MRLICHDCGYEIPEDMEFCPHCGCMRDKATPVSENGTPIHVCPSCGTVYGPGDQFCGSCGSRIPETPMYAAYPAPRMRRNGVLALVLAFIPGFFNIFGLGHFVMRQWSKGVMFLAISLILFYVNGGSFMPVNFAMTLVGWVVFFYHCMDIFRAVYQTGDE